jgi:hypothetical protein
LGQDTKTAATDEAAEGRLASVGKSLPSTGIKPTAKTLGKDRDMGSALRSVYQNTVEEPVPDDLLDLLSKLG